VERVGTEQAKTEAGEAVYLFRNPTDRVIDSVDSVVPAASQLVPKPVDSVYEPVSVDVDPESARIYKF